MYESLGELEYAAMVMELYGQGDVMPLFGRVVAATTQALAIAAATVSASPPTEERSRR